MLCPITKFLCPIQLYNTGRLFTKRCPFNIYPHTRINPEAYSDCSYSVYADYGQNYCPAPTKISKSELNLINTLRMLWEQHIAWTRMTIISIIAGLPDVDLVTERLLRHHIDFEKILNTFYGDVIASKFSDLFKSHLVIAAELVKAAKTGNKDAVANFEKRWYENADEIANFL